jgi:hypothetical protein
MYVILIAALALVIAISAVWTPIFALIIALPLFLLFLAYVGFSRSSDERAGPPGRGGEPRSGEGDSPTGREG